LFYRAIKLIRRPRAELVLDTEITRSPALRNLNGSRAAYMYIRMVERWHFKEIIIFFYFFVPFTWHGVYIRETFSGLSILILYKQKL